MHRLRAHCERTWNETSTLTGAEAKTYTPTGPCAGSPCSTPWRKIRARRCRRCRPQHMRGEDSAHRGEETHCRPRKVCTNKYAKRQVEEADGTDPECVGTTEERVSRPTVRPSTIMNTALPRWPMQTVRPT